MTKPSMRPRGPGDLSITAVSTNKCQVVISRVSYTPQTDTTVHAGIIIELRKRSEDMLSLIVGLFNKSPKRIHSVKFDKT